MGDQIVLDRDVRDWVLVPLTMSIVLMMLIRQYATQVRLVYEWMACTAPCYQKTCLMC